MTFLDVVLSIMNKWIEVFPQKRTTRNAIAMALCFLTNPSKNTITQGLVFGGLDQQDWSSSYKLASRCKWDTNELFRPVIEQTIPYYNENFISLAADDTKLKKTSRKIPGVQYHRDPLSPAFHTNFILGQRVMQIVATLPLYKQAVINPDDEDQYINVSRGIPVSLRDVPPVKKPGKKATQEEMDEYKALKRANNLSLAFVDEIKKLRVIYDEEGARDKTLIVSVDGSFCNSTVFMEDLDRINFIGRCRKDSKLCFEDTTSSRRFYAKDKFTPLSVRQDDSIEYQTTCLFIGKRERNVRYKELKKVFWQRGAGKKPLRLIVIAPTPYKASGTKRYYKDPAYLLTDNRVLDADELIQMYINRWEIEVNHREEKNNLGLGQAQVWNEQSVKKVPALLVAAYSIMLLASLSYFGVGRTDDFYPLPRWRKGSVKASCDDLKNTIRKELIENTNIQNDLKLNISDQSCRVVNRL